MNRDQTENFNISTIKGKHFLDVDHFMSVMDKVDKVEEAAKDTRMYLQNKICGSNEDSQWKSQKDTPSKTPTDKIYANKNELQKLILNCIVDQLDFRLEYILTDIVPQLFDMSHQELKEQYLFMFGTPLSKEGKDHMNLL